jgi:hypothetical protein
LFGIDPAITASLFANYRSSADAVMAKGGILTTRKAYLGSGTACHPEPKPRMKRPALMSASAEASRASCPT